MWRTIGITFERDGRHGDRRALRELRFQIVESRFTGGKPDRMWCSV
jgi:hypothetical protein